jgi:hypothetical protein
MNLTDYILIALIAAILCGAAYAIYRSKKSGKKCIGCPDSDGCAGNCAYCRGCGKNN